MHPIVILTGGTSGIGLAAAEALRARGCVVYEFSRRGAPQDPHHRGVDVTDEAAVRAAVAEILALEGRIDILVNNAGFGISGAVEMTDPADAHRLMEVNLFGMDNLIRAVLPAMRRAGSGRIVNVSSVAGVFPIPFQAWYSASKAAVRAMTVALANEVAPYGIGVCDVLPGDIRTGFTAARKKSAAGDGLRRAHRPLRGAHGEGRAGRHGSRRRRAVHRPGGTEEAGETPLRHRLELPVPGVPGPAAALWRRPPAAVPALCEVGWENWN